MSYLKKRGGEDMKSERGGVVKVGLEGVKVGVKVIKTYYIKFSAISKILCFKVIAYSLVTIFFKITHWAGV